MCIRRILVTFPNPGAIEAIFIINLHVIPALGVIIWVIELPIQGGGVVVDPFVVGRDGTREEVIKKYRAWAMLNITKADLLALSGKVLGCFCRPQACHGDVLVEMVMALTED